MKNLILLFTLCISQVVLSQTLDPTFGSGGIKTDQLSTTNSYEVCYGASLQSDGKIVYGGGSKPLDGHPYGFITRVNANGTFDTSFNLTGYVKTNTAIGRVAIQSDGKIIATGFDNIIRLNTNGSYDTTFNSTGQKTLTINSNTFLSKSFVPLSNGKILICGYTYNGTNYDFAVIRLNGDGSYDTTFNGVGNSIYAVGGGDDQCFGMAVQTDGKIVLTGQTFGGTHYNFAAIRINQDGTLDNTFGTLGKVVILYSANSYGNSIDIQSDGKILVTGSGSGNVFRLNTNGSLDTTFDSDGIMTLPIPVSQTNLTNSLLISNSKIKYLSTGKILVSFTSNNNFALVQLNSNGSVDTTFGTSGVATNSDLTDNSSFLLIRPDDKIITGGTSYDFANKIYYIKENLFSSSGILESSYNKNIDNGSSSINKTIQLQNGTFVSIIEARGSNTKVIQCVDNGLITNSTQILNFPNKIVAQINNYFVSSKYNLINSTFTPSIYKFDSSGALISSFGVNGVVDFTTNATNYISFINEIYYNPNDDYLYVGFGYDESIDNFTHNYISYGVCRLTSNGSIDTSFGVNGIAKIRFDSYGTNSSDESPEEISFQSDGKIIVAGSLSTLESNNYKTGIARFNPNGTLDTTFATSGKVISQVNTKNGPTELIMLSDDKFLLNITDESLSGVVTTLIQKYNSNGSLDTSFGTNGMVAENEYFPTMILQNDGKIIKAGQKNSHFTSSRYTSNGILDTTFGTSGYLTTPINVFSVINDGLITNDGKLLFTGFSYDGSGNLATQARYTDLALGTLVLTDNKNSFLVYPNPIQKEAIFEYSLNNEEIISIDIIDMQGKIVQKVIEKQNQVSGDHKQTISLSSDISQGNYFLRFSSQNGQKSVQIIKK